MLDTNTVSYIVKGNSSAARRSLASLRSPEVACISVITEGEIRYGLAKAGLAGKVNSPIEAFLAKILILDWDSDSAAVYGDLRARQEAAGKSIGNLDLLIAAHAIAAEAILITNDKALSQVDSLRGIANWATDLEPVEQ
jgi:tRNA(fMet)-specific endonuclease VapC